MSHVREAMFEREHWYYSTHQRTSCNRSTLHKVCSARVTIDFHWQML